MCCWGGVGVYNGCVLEVWKGCLDVFWGRQGGNGRAAREDSVMAERHGDESESLRCPSLQTQANLLQGVLDSLRFPFYVIDVASHRIRLANRAARTEGLGDGVTCHALVHGRATPCEQPDHPCPIATITETGEPTIVEHVHRDAEGRGHTVEVHAFPIFGEGGQVVQILEYCLDLDERRQAEREIRRLNEELEQRVRERTAELKTANDRLKEESGRRRLLERDLLEISEREQRRIGQELHDSLGQLLTGVAILSKALEQKLRRCEMAEAGDAKEIARLVNSAIQETRQLSRGLHPVALDENGLMSALAALAETTQSVFRVSCAFRCRQTVPMRDASTAVHLYRIAQEAVTNAIRHGKTQNIEIELSRVDSRATLTIRNDGRRFEGAPDKGKGIGLLMMHHRAEMIGGVLEVQSGPGGGTRVTCTLEMKSGSKEGETEDGLADSSE